MIQCSQCFEDYSFTEFANSKFYKKTKERVCGKCGSRFHADKWKLKTYYRGHDISTIHTGISFTDIFYETMIFKGKEILFSHQYATRDAAREGHYATGMALYDSLHGKGTISDLFEKRYL